MPFLGQDWRSPGEQWVRTNEGWERLQLWRLKVFENLNENVLARLLKLANVECLLMHNELKATPSQPHLVVTKRISRERKLQMSLAEALMRLDMRGAAKDLRRFNYVCKLLEFLVTYKLGSLSGASQKVFFDILEELLNQVVKTNNNVHTVQCLLRELENGLEHSMYDHVGSFSLWLRHIRTVKRMLNVVNELEIKARTDDGKLTMSDLPDDCIREILLRLNNHRDLVSIGLTESRTLQLSQEHKFWHHLCLFHFTNDRWTTVVRNGETLEGLGWRTLYMRLSRRYGLRDVFGEMLLLCQNCNTLFWEHHGHNCFVPDKEPQCAPITPAMCVELFTR